MNLTEDERKAILNIGNQTPGILVAPGIIGHLMVKGLIFINRDGQPELTAQGQKVYEGFVRP